MSRYSTHERWSSFNYEIGAGNLHTLLMPFREAYDASASAIQCITAVRRYATKYKTVLILRPLLYRHILYLIRSRVPHEPIYLGTKHTYTNQWALHFFQLTPRCDSPRTFSNKILWSLPMTSSKMENIRKQKRIKLRNKYVGMFCADKSTIWKHKFIRTKILAMQYTYAVKSYFSFEFLRTNILLETFKSLTNRWGCIFYATHRLFFKSKFCQ